MTVRRAVGQRLIRGVILAASVAGVTFLGFHVVPVNAATVGFVYLLLVLITATSWGLTESIITSLLAVACLNYFFLPPIGEFTIADAQNWVALFAFLVTAALVSKLSDVSRIQTKNAQDREQELERLYALSRAILLTEPGGSIASEAAKQIATIFQLTAVSLYIPNTEVIHRAGSIDLNECDDRLREVAIRGTQLLDAATATYVTAVRLGGEPIASLAVRGTYFSDSALQSTTNLLAIALERDRVLDQANRADVARRSEELKSTLLDAIAHEFKTPLTSIKLAASTLRSTAAASSEPVQHELASIIDEEADRLQVLVTNAIRMARIDAGRVKLNREPRHLTGIVDEALAEVSAASSGRVITREAGAGDLVNADSELLQIALRQLLDNALKYSPPGSPMSISIRADEGRILLRVKNEGQGIPEGEQALIFERFYRGPISSQQVAGTGMGLAILREIVRAHQGQVWVQSSPGQGAEFCISLPAAAEGAA